MILLVANAVSALLGQRSDAVIVVSMVRLGMGINFWQSYRAQRAAEALRTMVSPTASVSPDGHGQDVKLRDVVPGDLIRLSAGDLVPTDSQLSVAHDLSVQQSLLTGESLHADKASRPLDASTTGPDALTSCSSAHRSSAAPPRQSRSRRGRGHCSATSPRG